MVDRPVIVVGEVVVGVQLAGEGCNDAGGHIGEVAAEQNLAWPNANPIKKRTCAVY
jgi:hypothetical protein